MRVLVSAAALAVLGVVATSAGAAEPYKGPAGTMVSGRTYSTVLIIQKYPGRRPVGFHLPSAIVVTGPGRYDTALVRQLRPGQGEVGYRLPYVQRISLRKRY